MTTVRTLTVGLIVMLVASATGTDVAAQTTAAGTYYAPPAWSQTLPGSTRFIVLSNFNSEAVLDRETGLVWERSPLTTEVTWIVALNRCTGRGVASRMGWRLPTLTELQSLVDASQVSPALPQNHPFTNVVVVSGVPTVDPGYWSQTPWPVNPAFFMEVSFLVGDAVVSAPAFSVGHHVWCVRGPQ